VSFSRVFLAALLLAAPLVSAQEPRRIVAIGDVHGAYDQFVSILTRAGLIDAEQKWTGGRAMLVQTGDYTDRGAKVRQVLDLLMALEPRARSARGQVVALLGNHEVLNILGDMRYVTPEIASAFADERSESRRESAWKQYESLAAERAKERTTLPPLYRLAREEWMAAHPPGWLEYREALSARGRYGRWLRDKPIAANVDGTIFMHAGISPDLPATVDAVNSRARDEIARYEAYVEKLVEAKLALPFFTFDEVLQLSGGELEAAAAVMEAAKAKGAAPDLSAFNVPLLREGLEITKITEWSLAAPEGPLWFRGYANWPDDEPTRAKVSAFLDQSNVKRMVVGHTPTPDSRITPRFGGRVLLIDTGMLAPVYKGRPSALEILGTRLTAIYEDGAVPLTASSSPAKLLQR
jgi:Calcineurin-like phosphoesterase